MKKRKNKVYRKTSETEIEISLNIDGTGKYDVQTGVEFFDHMLESFARHGFFDLSVKASGDLTVDDHHTVEDVGILLGEVFNSAVGDKKGIKRISHSMVPMDEALAIVAVDVSGRSYCVMKMQFTQLKVGELSTENVEHFLESFASSARININAKLTPSGKVKMTINEEKELEVSPGESVLTTLSNNKIFLP
ncbi:MAG: imidazoleglycerol-phosphate dehydratase, partial [Methanobacteriaceae archaeon]|nr:imidazoleglycerol-phosphate dehydratase [Methanobacteriaceae archaeon]